MMNEKAVQQANEAVNGIGERTRALVILELTKNGQVLSFRAGEELDAAGICDMFVFQTKLKLARDNEPKPDTVIPAPVIGTPEESPA